eukprot:965940-Rhodomonas_salina.3
MLDHLDRLAGSDDDDDDEEEEEDEDEDEDEDDDDMMQRNRPSALDQRLQPARGAREEEKGEEETQGGVLPDPGGGERKKGRGGERGVVGKRAMLAEGQGSECKAVDGWCWLQSKGLPSTRTAFIDRARSRDIACTRWPRVAGSCPTIAVLNLSAKLLCQYRASHSEIFVSVPDTAQQNLYVSTGHRIARMHLSVPDILQRIHRTVCCVSTGQGIAKAYENTLCQYRARHSERTEQYYRTRHSESIGQYAVSVPDTA